MMHGPTNIKTGIFVSAVKWRTARAAVSDGEVGNYTV